MFAFAIIVLLMIGVCYCIGRVRLAWRWAKARGLAAQERADKLSYKRGYEFASVFELQSPVRLSTLTELVNVSRQYGRWSAFDRGIEDYVKTQTKIKRMMEKQS